MQNQLFFYVCAPNSFFLLKLMIFILGNLYFVPENVFMGKRVDAAFAFFGLIKNNKLTISTI